MTPRLPQDNNNNKLNGELTCKGGVTNISLYLLFSTPSYHDSCVQYTQVYA